MQEDGICLEKLNTEALNKRRHTRRQIGIRAAYHPQEYWLIVYPQLQFSPGNRATLKKERNLLCQKIFPILLVKFWASITHDIVNSLNIIVINYIQ